MTFSWDQIGTLVDLNIAPHDSSTEPATMQSVNRYAESKVASIEKSLCLLEHFINGALFKSKLANIKQTIDESKADFDDKVAPIRARQIMWHNLSSCICGIVDVSTEYADITDYNKVMRFLIQIIYGMLRF